MTMATINSAPLGNWDSLLGLTPSGGYPTHFVNTYGFDFAAPAGVPKAWWCQRISTAGKTSAQLVNETLDALGPISELNVENGKPGLTMWDELNSASINVVAAAASAMGAYPALAQRWGSYVVNGANINYHTFVSAFDALLGAGGRIGIELYPYYVYNPAYHSASLKNYWHGGGNTAVRDEWMRQYFMGGSIDSGNPVDPVMRPHPIRLAWLMYHRATVWPTSWSVIHPIFGVSARHINGSQPNRFMDRMFYAFQGTVHGALMSDANDFGAGSWTWVGSGSTDWDGWFRVMWDYYCQNFSASKPPRTSAPSAP